MASALRERLRTLVVAICVGATLLTEVGHAQRGPAGTTRDVAIGWRLNAVWSVGGAEDTSLVIATLRAKDIAVRDGTLLIADRVGSRIARYSATGGALPPVGRGPGAGPGELRFPTSVAVDPGGRILVQEPENGRISYFDANGRFLKQRSYNPSGSITQLRADADSSLIGIVRRGDSIALARLTDGGLQWITAIAAPRRLGTRPVCSTTGYVFDVLFSPMIHFATAGSVLAYSTGDAEVTFLRGGRPFAKHSHPFEPRRTNRAMARAHLGRGIRMQAVGHPVCTVPAEMLLAAAEMAPVLPAYGALAIEPDGIVWATRYPVGDEAAVADVFDPRTGYVGTVAIGAARPVAFLSRSLLVSLESDDDDVPVVRVYRITR
jgi:hypothetical protein